MRLMLHGGSGHDGAFFCIPRLIRSPRRRAARKKHRIFSAHRRRACIPRSGRRVFRPAQQQRLFFAAPHAPAPAFCPPARPPEPSGLPRSADIAPAHPCRGPDVTKKAGHGSNRQERERNISSSCGPGGLCFLHAGTLPSPLILWRHPCHIPSLSLLFPAALC